MTVLRLVSIALVLTIFACKQDRKSDSPPGWSTTTVQLSCMELEGEETSPRFAIYLQAGERKTKIAEINSTCNGITPDEYPAYEIPPTALSAIGGWWAGAGDYFYAVVEADMVEVYQGFIDEMQEEPGYNYRLIATYDGKKFNLTQ